MPGPRDGCLAQQVCTVALSAIDFGSGPVFQAPCFWKLLQLSGMFYSEDHLLIYIPISNVLSSWEATETTQCRAGATHELASKYRDCMKEHSSYPPYVVDKGCLFQSELAHITSFPHLFPRHQTLVMFSCRAPMPLLWKKTLVQSSFRSMNTTSDWST